MVWHLIILVGIVVCAIQAIRVHRLLISAIWLAGCSALVALMMYLAGAPEVAVIELSVGAGLVTVLFVFAINIAGEEAISVRAFIPRPLAWLLTAGALLLFAWLFWPGLLQANLADAQAGFAETLWQDRSLDTLLQIVLIFAGTLGVIGLLAEGKSSEHKEKTS
jgi:uncharacterized MnhB-related membrane protein